MLSTLGSHCVRMRPSNAYKHQSRHGAVTVVRPRHSGLRQRLTCSPCPVRKSQTRATRRAVVLASSSETNTNQGDLSSWFKNLLTANSAGKKAEEEAEEALKLAKPKLSAQQLKDQTCVPGFSPA
eukprot:5221872-Pyramimonas_sp.AAC.1